MSVARTRRALVGAAHRREAGTDLFFRDRVPDVTGPKARRGSLMFPPADNHLDA